MMLSLVALLLGLETGIEGSLWWLGDIVVNRWHTLLNVRFLAVRSNRRGGVHAFISRYSCRDTRPVPWN